MSKTSSKLALGSANFGLEYGLTNATGKISDKELASILNYAVCAGVDLVDTAQAYGDSEVRIGSHCDNAQFEIITKIGVELDNKYFARNLTSSVKQSCKRLNKKKLYAVMLHRPEVLLTNQGNAIIRALEALKEQGVIEKIGVSVYSPDILASISTLFELDIVQVPFNIFDQQILSSGWSDKLKRNGVEIHTRSVFLQGLLLMKRCNLPGYFIQSWPAHFDAWYGFLNDSRADALEVALKFALDQEWIDKIVVGVDSVAQLKTLVEIEKAPKSFNFPLSGCTDANLINPSKWSLT